MSSSRVKSAHYLIPLVSAVSKKQKMFLPHPRVKASIAGSLRDREVACSVSDRQGSNFESCVWRTVSSQSSHHPQEVLLAQFSLYVHKGGLKPDSFHFYTPSLHSTLSHNMAPPDEQWAMLILSDESRFNLFNNDGSVGVWRTHSERSFPEVKPRKKHYPIRHGVEMHRWVVTLYVRGQCIVIVTINPLLDELYNLIFLPRKLLIFVYF